MTASGQGVILAILLSLGALACGSDDGNGDDSSDEPIEGTPDLDPLPLDIALPIVFVHGFAGSAQQYESQAIRFAANGYPRERIRAYDHDGAGVDFAAYAAGVDAMVDAARADFGVEKVYLVGHSRGTTVSSNYLGVPSQAAKIAKYISLDGFGCDAANAAGVPCIAPNQGELPGQAHVEVATSAESFKKQYEFFVGQPPQVWDIVQQAGPVEISGRVVDFPANTGRAGTTLEIYEIDSTTGYRKQSSPLATFAIGEDGNFGPATVRPDRYYEMALLNPGRGTQHFYTQRFLRTSHLVRLLSGNPDTAPSRLNTNSGPGHAAVIAIRMREWYSSDDADKPGDESDVLEIGTDSPGGSESAVNVIQSFVGNGAIALHLHDDAATPKQSTLEPLPFFSTQPFQNGVDIYMPAADPPDGTITVTNLPRGDAGKPQVLRFPNWSSDNHIITLFFSDYAQE